MLTFRQLEMQDLDATAKLHALSGSSGYRGMLSDEYLDGPRLPQSMESWTRRLSRSTSEALSLGAFFDGRLIGLLFVEYCQDENLGALLDTLHVHPEHRGSRVAELLIRDAADRMLRSQGDGPLHLRVFEVNARARRLYDRLGGTVVRNQLGRGPDGSPIQECLYFWPAASNLLVSSAA